MKILQLGPYPPPNGGVQTNLVAIRKRLLDEGHSCQVINLTRHRQAEQDDIFYPHSAKETLQLLLHLQYDVVHLHIGGNLTNRLLALGLVCTQIPGTKAVLTFHSGGFPSSAEGRAMNRRSFAGFVLRRFDRLIAVNAEIEKFFIRCGAQPRRVRMIAPHALAPPPPGTKLPPQVQQFFDTHKHVLLSVNGLETEYDLPLQIDVMEQFPGVGLLILGSGSLESEIRAMIAAKPYAKDILLAGDVPHAATLLAIQKADMMLRTTHYDGDSICVREALYLGTPVIASNNGMRPGGCDLVPMCDEEALEDAISKRLSDGQRRMPSVPTGDNIKSVLALYRELIG